MKNYIKLSEKGIAIICGMLSFIILGVDVFTPVGVNTPLLYLITIFLALSSEKSHTVTSFAIVTSSLTLGEFFISASGEAFVEGMINRALVLCAIWTIVIIGIRFKNVQERVWILAAMVESSEDSIVGKNHMGKVIYWNKGAERLYGYTAGEMIGESIQKVFPEELKNAELEVLAKLKSGQRLTNYESVHLRKDGVRVSVSLSISPITTFGGKFIGASTITRDITQRKKKEKENQQKLNDLKEKIQRQTLGSQILEKNIVTKVKALKDKEEKLYEVIREHGRIEQKFQSAQEEVDELESEIKAKNKLLEDRNKKLEVEIEEHKKTEETLRESQKRLKELGAHLTSVREQERSTMAREIHDELGQLLTAIKMDLSWFEENAFDGDKQKYLTRIEETENLIDATIASVQRIVAQLRPSILDDLGVIEAIKWQAKEFTKRSNLACDVNINSHDIKLSNDASTAIFRVFQESLTNIARHAKATKINVDVNRDDDQLCLKIKDDGRGLSKEMLSSSHSFGLMGMRERIEMISGRIDFEGKKDKGTTVNIFVPLKDNEVTGYD